MSLKIELPAKLRCFFNPARYKVAYGGRGSAKSESIARIMIVKSMQSKRRILCCREYQKSIKDSVLAILKSIISSHELGDYFEVTAINIKCKSTGSEFVFAGLSEATVDSIKSLYGFTDVWIEEAQRLSQRSMDLLLPTIRAAGSEFYFTFNPELESDPVYKRFVGVPDSQDDAIVVEMNYSDNPWFPDVLQIEMEACKRRSNDDYLHIWEGKTRSFTKASILGHLVKEMAFEPNADWTPYFALDWGFANDPTVLLKMYYNDKKLYVRNEFYAHNIEIDEYGKMFKTVPGADKYELLADNARPECISYLNNPNNFADKRPLKVKAAPKWPGSVEDGIAWLRALDAIIVHPDCKNSVFEIPRWSWKVDKITGDILPVPLSGMDHCCDCLRYGCGKFIKRKITMFDAM